MAKQKGNADCHKYSNQAKETHSNMNWNNAGKTCSQQHLMKKNRILCKTTGKECTNNCSNTE